MLSSVPVALAACIEGKVTGGGQIEIPGGVASFGFNAMASKGNSPVKGELEYLDHVSRDKVHAHDLTYVHVWQPNPPSELPNQPNPEMKAMFRGPCTINKEDGFRFEVYVEDHGEPGVNDVFYIRVWHQGNGIPDGLGGEIPPSNPALLTIVAWNILLNGNIQIHKPPVPTL
jgi:hypothetical protein